MGFVSDVGSEVNVEVNSNMMNPPIRRTRSTTRRKRKTMNSHQASFVRRCHKCDTTKTPQWREGPDGPKTLCNACGVRYSRERQDKLKPRKTKKSKSKNGVRKSGIKRSRSVGRDLRHYDIAFLFSNNTPSVIRTSDDDQFTRKEYAAALSLVSLAILGGTTETIDAKMELSDNKVTPDVTCRRSQRIKEANKACNQYYGGFNFDEWVPNFMDMDEASFSESPTSDEGVVAMGFPCIWAAMSPYCKDYGQLKTPNQDESLGAPACPSSASNSAKSEVYTMIKSNDQS